MDKKKAILVVSFGTSHNATREKTIGAIENDIKNSFTDFRVRRAFTSERVINIIQKNENITVDNVKAAMEKLYLDGIEEVHVQPTHIVNGEEYEKTLSMLKEFNDKFKSIVIGAPLLTSLKDFEESCNAIIDRTRYIKKDQVLLLMGHGTGHKADTAYIKLEKTFESMGYDNYLVATVEGNIKLENVILRLKSMNPTTIYLIPFMVVAGEHAINDMCGEDEDSWESILKKEGFNVQVIVEGLGENPDIRKVYKNHIFDCPGGCKPL